MKKVSDLVPLKVFNDTYTNVRGIESILLGSESDVYSSLVSGVVTALFKN